MKIAVVTLFPSMFEAITNYGITQRALQNKQVELSFWNPYDFLEDKNARVDDRPFGGGPGMVIRPGPLQTAIGAAKGRTGPHTPVIVLTPAGEVLREAHLQSFVSKGQNVILVSGRYEGVDERLIDLEADDEWSLGDYVTSGGELPAMVIIDALVRLLPGALGHEDSAKQDSFSDPNLLDCPHYTRPQTFQGMTVPSVLLSGDHEKIRQWRLQQSLGRTWERRPDLLAKKPLNAAEYALLQDYISIHLNKRCEHE
ncbi:MAG: tRNA (guanosine(37)-N1)-methyltransferase TrmD [Gammaproteobacteria bacterium]|nr:tRNA (guanosine(37)-N1)-methyltransferase TrmD [Gammaproteobacteria bacterium]